MAEQGRVCAVIGGGPVSQVDERDSREGLEVTHVLHPLVGLQQITISIHMRTHDTSYTCPHA